MMDSLSGQKHWDQVYDALRGVAAKLLNRERVGHTLQPTALVHEAWLRLGSIKNISGMDRAQFMAAAAVAMRRVLVDYARAKGRDKRGGGWERTSLDTCALIADVQEVDVVALDAALLALAQSSPRRARIVELRYFGGLGTNEVAQVLQVSERTVKLEWRSGTAWLRRQLL